MLLLFLYIGKREKNDEELIKGKVNDVVNIIYIYILLRRNRF